MIRWSPDAPLSAETWGPGRDWLLAQVPAMIGDSTSGAHLELDPHPVVATTARANRHVRFGASATLYHELLPTIIEQRITNGEAKQQWSQLCRELSTAAPGPFTRLLPPAPGVLRRQPSWWFHPLGIERKRAQPLIEVARHASKMWDWAELDPTDVARMLRLIPGIGVWTVGCVLAPALGDADAVPVGDYHVKNIVAWNLVNEARATDERMLELLVPDAGQRGLCGPGDHPARQGRTEVRAEATHHAHVGVGDRRPTRSSRPNEPLMTTNDRSLPPPPGATVAADPPAPLAPPSADQAKRPTGPDRGDRHRHDRVIEPSRRSVGA